MLERSGTLNAAIEVGEDGGDIEGAEAGGDGVKVGGGRALADGVEQAEAVNEQRMGGAQEQGDVAGDGSARLYMVIYLTYYVRYIKECFPELPMDRDHVWVLEIVQSAARRSGAAGASVSTRSALSSLLRAALRGARLASSQSHNAISSLTLATKAMLLSEGAGARLAGSRACPL